MFQHKPVKDIVIGSYGANGDKDLGAILAKYLQVVDFSGAPIDLFPMPARFGRVPTPRSAPTPRPT